ncbi:MAG: phosphoglycerate kinase [Candidatus Diapherotrites archaeon]|nr:phosphoglycerate kinase [Candidatus Diapherotrites archaeon]
MGEYKFISKENVEGKTIVVRADLNSNVENGELFAGARIKEHAKTMKFLSEKGAKVVVLAHQGRKGDEDFSPLDQHAAAISEEIEKPVKLVKWSEDYVAAIQAMQNGDIILMDNVREFDDEEKEFTPEEASKLERVQKIGSVSNMFVQDALSVCHRSQPSVVGFTALLPSYVGPVLEKEVNALKHYDKGEKPCVFILGGAKIEDSLKLIKVILDNGKADTVCVGGLFGELFLKAAGKKLGEKDKFFEEKNLMSLVEPAKQLLDAHGEKIVLPVDVAAVDDDDERKELTVDELPTDYLVCDIGTETAALFKQKLKKAKFAVFNGPLGMFERYGFEVGTKRVFDALKSGKAFALLGGGDTETAIEQLEFSFEDFSHVSLAGKALLTYLSGKELPGLKVLQK